MALIPAGPFEMGRKDGDNNEKPVHTVMLDDFYIDQYEVTNVGYAECVDANTCTPPLHLNSNSRENYYGNYQYDGYPVVYVSWDNAQTYCQWRGGRLPTEAEWEKAARGGLEGALYPWGNDAPDCKLGAINGAKFDDDAACNGTDTEKVGSYQGNGYGLFDMAGNVWEWVADFYGENYYATLGDNFENPTGPDVGDYRVLRGGSWGRSVNICRTAFRFCYNPDDSYNFVGFRISRTP